jgi:hypothetical protein
VINEINLIPSNPKNLVVMTLYNNPNTLIIIPKIKIYLIFFLKFNFITGLLLNDMKIKYKNDKS